MRASAPEAANKLVAAERPPGLLMTAKALGLVVLQSGGEESRHGPTASSGGGNVTRSAHRHPPHVQAHWTSAKLRAW